MSAEQEQQAMEGYEAEAEVDEYEEDEYEEEYVGGGHRFMLFMAMPAWLVSMVVHAGVLFILALWPMPTIAENTSNLITAAAALEDMEELEEFEEEALEAIDIHTDVVMDVSPVPMTTDMVPEDVTEVAIANDIDAAAISVDLVDFSEVTAPKGDLLTEIGSYSGTGLEGRGSAKARAAMVRAGGGSAGSEAAVAAALKWLAAAQTADGGWNFDHRFAMNTNIRAADHPGEFRNSRNGATAMAVLPFMGAGQTHTTGEYKATVKGGLSYLMTHMKRDGSMHEKEGNMYSHGLAAIALSEAYAMTHDKALMAPAQASLNFIAYAQDPVGGGWRYSPRQPGDTSVVGWQLMALKSGHMAYLQVHPNTIRGAIRFLDTVQSGSGAYYGYTTPGRGSAQTAVGLLCRMYLGWTQDNDALKRGVEYLGTRGPNNTDMYYNYYATQVMRQFGGEHWDKWNARMRDMLVNKQDKTGPAKGSWYFSGGHGAKRGGRIYNTSLATMILEVYYRHMPIYQKKAATEEFPL